LIREFKNSWVKIFLVVSILFSFCVMILTQSKSCLLGTGMIVATHGMLRLNSSRVLNGIRQLFTLKALVVFIIIGGVIRFLINKYYSLYSIIINYWDVLIDRFENVLYTAFEVQTSAEVEEDASAMGRVASFDFLKENIDNPKVLVVGNGYKYEFMDVPPIEMLANHGLVGCFIFCTLNFFFLMFSLKEIRLNRSPLGVFAASFFMYFPALLLTSGRPYDIAYWFPYIFFVRFLGIPYLAKKTNQLNQSGNTIASTN
jgi:hypothetical protein